MDQELSNHDQIVCPKYLPKSKSWRFPTMDISRPTSPLQARYYLQH